MLSLNKQLWLAEIRAPKTGGRGAPRASLPCCITIRIENPEK